ncbi:MAG: hypothetical protein ACERKO_03730 [Acetanaerobacterium sp.]
MEFYEKLSAVMSALAVSNSRLALALSVDTSLVSRWRKGTRVPGKNSGFIAAISRYFATVAKMEYQRVALCEIMGRRLGEHSMEETALAGALEQWLSYKDGADAVDTFLNELLLFQASAKTPSYPHAPAAKGCPSEQWVPSGEVLGQEVFYGTQGKQHAVVRFLSLVLLQKEPCTLLLYSDEDMEWLFRDKAFYRRWGCMMGKAIEKGCDIRIVHTISRDIVEMLSCIEAWLPLYLTGAIAPYYYPKYYKSIFCRTMFIASGIASVTSESLSSNSENTTNLFCTDKKMVASLEERFQGYLTDCRPLMRIITARNIRQSLNVLDEFGAEQSDMVYRADYLSPHTMPPALFASIAERAPLDISTQKILTKIQKKQSERLLNSIKQFTHTEYLSLPDYEQIISGSVRVPYFGLLGVPTVFYRPKEYAQHLRAVVDLLKSQAGYSCYITGAGPIGVTLQAKEDVGALIVKSSAPPAIFALNQPNMAAAFYSHIEAEREKIPQDRRLRRYVTDTLGALITRLEAAQDD